MRHLVPSAMGGAHLNARTAALLLSGLLLAAVPLRAGFRLEQLRYARVQEAYRLCRDALASRLEARGLRLEGIELYLRAFKWEMAFEVWARNDRNAPFVLVENYPICRTSGSLGPKRKEGDKQIPEGFYRIDRFNPESRFLLSLGIDFPNPADRARSPGLDPGGLIFIHGSCLTDGCIPLTDEWIRRLYVLCVEAREGGQGDIPIHVFPGRLDSVLYKALCEQYRARPDVLGLWADMKRAYDLFSTRGSPPRVRFLPDGRQEID